MDGDIVGLKYGGNDGAIGVIVIAAVGPTVGFTGVSVDVAVGSSVGTLTGVFSMCMLLDLSRKRFLTSLEYISLSDELTSPGLLRQVPDILEYQFCDNVNNLSFKESL